MSTTFCENGHRVRTKLLFVSSVLDGHFYIFNKHVGQSK
jgi:hypothetical protein